MNPLPVVASQVFPVSQYMKLKVADGLPPSVHAGIVAEQLAIVRHAHPAGATPRQDQRRDDASLSRHRPPHPPARRRLRLDLLKGRDLGVRVAGDGDADDVAGKIRRSPRGRRVGGRGCRRSAAGSGGAAGAIRRRQRAEGGDLDERIAPAPGDRRRKPAQAGFERRHCEIIQAPARQRQARSRELPSPGRRTARAPMSGGEDTSPEPRSGMPSASSGPAI